MAIVALGFDATHVDEVAKGAIATASRDSSSLVSYNWARFQSNPPGCDLMLEGDPDNKTWPAGCPTNNCNIPVEACNYKSTTNSAWCYCSFGNAKCWSIASLTEAGQVSGVICMVNGCALECDLVLWQLGGFYACFC